jgi:FMN phosphatase YigB (HAD superfamily)
VKGVRVVVGLIVCDVGSTLGRFGKPSTADILHRLSKLPETEGKRRIIEEEERRFLHTAPALTAEVIDGICGALLIDPATWPHTWPGGRFAAFDYTPAALAELRKVAPIVTLSNVGILCGPERMSNLVKQCGTYIDEVFTSYSLACRKPDPRLWVELANGYGIPTSEVVHIGDQWVNDVCGATFAGARAICVAATRAPAPMIPAVRDWPPGPDRIAVVDDLRQAVAVVQEWATR